MKITIRLIVSLIFVIALVAIVFSYYQVSSEERRLVSELERRTTILAESLQESVKPLVESDSLSRLNRLVERFGNRERLKGVAVFDKHWQYPVINARSYTENLTATATSSNLYYRESFHKRFHKN